MNNIEIYTQAVLSAPMPTDAQIQAQHTIDIQQNPHNDSYKPAIRSTDEIIIDLKIKYAKLLCKRAFSIIL